MVNVSPFKVAVTLSVWMRRWHLRSVAQLRVPNRSKGRRHRRSLWPANTPSYAHPNRHIPHPSSSFPLLLQNTSSTLLLFMRNSPFGSQRSPLTSHLVAQVRIHTSRRVSQMEVSMFTTYIHLLASTIMRRRSRRHGQLRSLTLPTVTPCWSRSQRVFHSPCTISLMRRCKLSMSSPHSPHSLQRPLS